MPDPLYIDHAHGRTWLKWHRGRRQAGDMEFDPARILQGMRAGARVEIDLVRHAGGGFAVLHDDTLDRGTTGTGRVDAADADTIRALRRRDDAGQVTDVRVALLADLCADLAGVTSGQLQLDLKEGAAALTPADVTAFVQAVAPVAPRMILSGGDAAAVAMLADALPDMQTGYDPCHFGAMAALAASRDYAGFVARALRDAGRATMIYLEYPAILAAADDGFDLIAAFGAAGRAVDAYTVNAVTPATLAHVRRLMALGVDQITTDDPAGLWAACQA